MSLNNTRESRAALVAGDVPTDPVSRRHLMEIVTLVNLDYNLIPQTMARSAYNSGRLSG